MGNSEIGSDSLEVRFLSKKRNEKGRKKREGLPILKQFCFLSQIEEELKEAGLAVIRAVPISQFSDRVFIIANRGL